MRTLLAVLLLALVGSLPAQADIAVVLHQAQGVESLSRVEVINIFMGRYRRLPAGESAAPADLEPLKARFYRALLGKDLAEINSYWARLVFSGQASPPVQLRDSTEMLAYLRRNPGAIGFIEAGDVPTDLWVVLMLTEVKPL